MLAAARQAPQDASDTSLVGLRGQPGPREDPARGLMARDRPGARSCWVTGSLGHWVTGSLGNGDGRETDPAEIRQRNSPYPTSLISGWLPHCRIAGCFSNFI